jgi:hypothetical protein
MYLVSNPVFSRRRGKGLIRSDVVEDFTFVKKPTGLLFPFPIHRRFFLENFSACANSQTLGDFAEPILVLDFEIPQKIPSLSHKFQQTTPGMKIFGLFPEMIGEVVDPFCQ